MGNIVAGAILIGIGLIMGGSVFTGDFDIVTIFFDALGTFWIVKGIVQIYKARTA